MACDKQKPNKDIPMTAKILPEWSTGKQILINNLSGQCRNTPQDSANLYGWRELLKIFHLSPSSTVSDLQSK